MRNPTVVTVTLPGAVVAGMEAVANDAKEDINYIVASACQWYLQTLGAMPEGEDHVGPTNIDVINERRRMLMEGDLEAQFNAEGEAPEPDPPE